jgi:predicted O-methyltransferase YrrM
MSEHSLDPSPAMPGSLKPVHPAVEAYLFDLLRRHDEPVLQEMEALARERSFPIVGRLVGAFLEVLTLCAGARRVFEFGSGFGYSAYWFGRAVGPEGRVICTDGQEANRRQARTFLARVGRWGRIDFRVGWAQDIFRGTEGLFDVVYNDADKEGDPGIWRLARDRVRPGGLYIADNTLWSGRVIQEPAGDDPRPELTRAISEHNRLIAADPEYDFFLNPTRDGVIVARRKSTQPLG